MHARMRSRRRELILGTFAVLSLVGMRFHAGSARGTKTIPGLAPPRKESLCARAAAVPAAAKKPRFRRRAEEDADEQSHSWLARLRAYPAGLPPIEARLETFRRWQQLAVPKDATGAAQWTLIGPQPETSSANCFTATCSGRVTAIAVNPAAPATVYAGTAAGGVWKTTNGGANWRPLTDSAPSLAIGSLALDPLDPDTIYAGTGEQNDSSHEYPGAGILKSTDAGANWTLLASSVFGGQTIGALAVSPSNSAIVLAAAKFGIYRSQDSGATWRRVLPTDVPADAVIFNPTSPNMAYASVGGSASSAYTGVYVSMDGGETWRASNGSIGLQEAGRIALAISPTTPSTVYAGVSSTDSSSLTVYRSDNGGADWQPMSGPSYCAPVSTLETAQCNYNNVLAVSPTNPSLLLGGGIHLLVSTNGGAAWSNSQSIHVDQHAIAFTPNGSRVYVGNDGGVWAGDISGSQIQWSSLNAELALAQFYPGISFDTANNGYGGTQDNNVLRYSGDLEWSSVSLGDGAATAIASNGDVYFALAGGEAKPNPVWKSTAGGQFVAMSSGIDGNTKPFPPFLAVDLSNPSNVYYTGLTQLYQSTDGAATWSVIPQNPSVAFGSPCTIAVSPSDSNTVYAGGCDGLVWVTRNALQGANSSWTKAVSGLPLKPVTRITIDPNSPKTAYVTLSGSYSGHIYRTDNAGGSWSDITGNIPDISVNGLALDPGIPNAMYAATDLGVYWTDNGGKVWTVLGSGLPNSPVVDVVLHKSRTLFAATHGRSMWNVSVPVNANPIPTISAAALTTSTSLSITGQGFLAGSVVYWNGVKEATTVVSSMQLTAQLSAGDVQGDQLATVSVFNPGPGGGQSPPAYVKIGPAPAILPGGIVNGASFAAGYGLAPGSLATIFGVDLSTGTASAGSGALPVALGDTSLAVLDANITAPYSARLLFTSATQVNFQVPWNVRPGDTADFQPVVAGSRGVSITDHILPFAPGIFTVGPAGANQGAIEDSVGHLAAPAPIDGFPSAQPVRRGDFISIFCTGLGTVTNPSADGSPALNDPLSITVITPTVLIGGAEAPAVQFSGLAPGFVGLNQVNVQIPANAPTGSAVPLLITDGHGTYSNTVYLAIQ